MGLKKNQKVVLHGCAEAEVYPGVVFSVKVDSYERSGKELVKLKELGGEWHVECLRALTQKEVRELTNPSCLPLERGEKKGTKVTK